jgi:hypothetical protein
MGSDSAHRDNPQLKADMNPNGHAIQHFDDMRRLATELETLPATVLRHSYHAEAFGSWSMTMRFNGRVFRLSCDGRDGVLTLERSTTAKEPRDWQPFFWTGALDSDGQVPISQVKMAVETEQAAANTRPRA